MSHQVGKGGIHQTDTDSNSELVLVSGHSTTVLGYTRVSCNLPNTCGFMWWSRVSGIYQSEASSVHQSKADQNLVVCRESSAQEWWHWSGLRWKKWACPRATQISFSQSLPRSPRVSSPLGGVEGMRMTRLATVH